MVKSCVFEIACVIQAISHQSVANQSKEGAMTRNKDAVKLYKSGLKISEIAQLQNRPKANVSQAIHLARKREPDCAALKKPFNFDTHARNLNVSTGALGPTLKRELCPKVQKWILDKTVEGNYDTIVCFITDLVAEAYFDDQ